MKCARERTYIYWLVWHFAVCERIWTTAIHSTNVVIFMEITLNEYALVFSSCIIIIIIVIDCNGIEKRFWTIVFEDFETLLNYYLL